MTKTERLKVYEKHARQAQRECIEIAWEMHGRNYKELADKANINKAQLMAYKAGRVGMPLKHFINVAMIGGYTI